MRHRSIEILSGDRVNIEVSRYDSTRGRIIYRLRNKDSTISQFSTSTFLSTQIQFEI
ncbi:hypothetical protein BVRB_5g109380 [Beta vulgaris subsp. vulgaris]|nr:hypothetical protein BVRB_5g109380 [Beta vulgaris subsp. vulgaris]